MWNGLKGGKQRPLSPLTSYPLWWEITLCTSDSKGRGYTSSSHPMRREHTVDGQRSASVLVAGNLLHLLLIYQKNQIGYNVMCVINNKC